MNKPQDPRRALGKGLSALLPSRPAAVPVAPPSAVAGAGSAGAAVAAEPVAPPVAAGGLVELPIVSVHPNPNQPRTTFAPEKLAELAGSIRTNGIIQPLLVRKRGNDYEIVAGERRWRAAQIAGLETVPCVIQDVADDNVLTLALIENIQRDDLNAIETAVAFDRLSRELNLTHEEIGKRTGKDRTTITNFLRLLRLPREVQAMVAEGKISNGHARALLSLPTEELMHSAAERILREGLSVRAAEKLAQTLTEPPVEKSTKQLVVDANVQAAEEELRRALGTKVHIVAKGDKRGKIEIEYYSQEELQRLYGQLVGEN